MREARSLDSYLTKIRLLEGDFENCRATPQLDQNIKPTRNLSENYFQIHLRKGIGMGISFGIYILK